MLNSIFKKILAKFHKTGSIILSEAQSIYLTIVHGKYLAFREF
jgi:hypothetical protein